MKLNTVQKLVKVLKVNHLVIKFFYHAEIHPTAFAGEKLLHTPLCFSFECIQGMSGTRNFLKSQFMKLFSERF